MVGTHFGAARVTKKDFYLPERRDESFPRDANEAFGKYVGEDAGRLPSQIAIHAERIGDEPALNITTAFTQQFRVDQDRFNKQGFAPLWESINVMQSVLREVGEPEEHAQPCCQIWNA